MDIVKHNIRIYYLTQLSHSLIFIIPIWIVYYQSKITIPQISFLVTIQYVTQMVLELPSGALADLIGRRNTNLIGFIIGAASYLLFPFATEFWHFVILVCMIGLNDSFRSGSEEALIYDSYKQENKTESYSKMYGKGEIIYQTGLITATALGGFIFELNNTLPYTLYGISLLIGSILIFFYKEPKIDTVKFTIKNYTKQIINGSKEVFKDKYTKYLSLFYIV